MLLSQIRHSCKSDPAQEPSNTKLHVWSPFLQSWARVTALVHLFLLGSWQTDFPFTRGRCAQTQFWPFSQKSSPRLQISKVEFILLDVEHKLCYSLWGKSSPSSNLQMLFWAVHIFKSPCSLIDLLRWNCQDFVRLLKTSVKINSLKRNPFYPTNKDSYFRVKTREESIHVVTLLPWAPVCRILY